MEPKHGNNWKIQFSQERNRFNFFKNKSMKYSRCRGSSRWGTGKERMALLHVSSGRVARTGSSGRADAQVAGTCSNELRASASPTLVWNAQVAGRAQTGSMPPHRPASHRSPGRRCWRRRSP